MRERAESANAVMALARGTSQASTTCAPRENGRKIRSQKAARQSRRHRRCIAAAAADAEPVVAAAATDADKLGGAPVREGSTPWRVGRRARAGGLRPFRRPLSQKTGPVIRRSYWLVTAAAGCAAARRIPDLSTYAAAPRMLTNTGCTALHVVPANGQELNALNGFGEDQFVYMQAPFLSP